MWTWGDADGDGDVDALDIVRIVNSFRGRYGPGMIFEQANLWGCLPDYTIDALDITVDVDAFRGFRFPCAASCP
jgi:hypothetical protein